MSAKDAAAARNAEVFAIDSGAIVRGIVEQILESDGDRIAQLVEGEVQRRVSRLDLIDAKGIAQRTGFHIDKVRRMLSDHKVKGICTGERGKRYRVSVIDEFLTKLEA